MHTPACVFIFIVGEAKRVERGIRLVLCATDAPSALAAMVQKCPQASRPGKLDARHRLVGCSGHQGDRGERRRFVVR